MGTGNAYELRAAYEYVCTLLKTEQHETGYYLVRILIAIRNTMVYECIYVLLKKLYQRIIVSHIHRYETPLPHR